MEPSSDRDAKTLLVSRKARSEPLTGGGRLNLSEGAGDAGGAAGPPPASVLSRLQPDLPGVDVQSTDASLALAAAHANKGDR